MISLFTTFYNEKNVIRRDELLFCLQKNIENRWIDRIYILDESNDDLNNPKIILKKLKRRPFFNDFLNIVNQNTGNDDINIISNTDIYFDDTLKTISKISDHSLCLALNRWNVLNNTIKFEIGFGQDTWIFKGQIRDNIEAFFFNGLPASDNRFAFELRKVGYKVINPSLSVKSFHMHNSRIRSYQSEVLIPGPYYYPLPAIIFSTNSKLQLKQFVLWIIIRIRFFNDFCFTVIDRKKYRIFRKRVIDFNKVHFPFLIALIKKLKNIY